MHWMKYWNFAACVNSWTIYPSLTSTLISLDLELTLQVSWGFRRWFWSVLPRLPLTLVRMLFLRVRRKYYVFVWLSTEICFWNVGEGNWTFYRCNKARLIFKLLEVESLKHVKISCERFTDIQFVNYALLSNSGNAVCFWLKLNLIHIWIISNPTYRLTTQTHLHESSFNWLSYIFELFIIFELLFHNKIIFLQLRTPVEPKCAPFSHFNRIP